MQRKAKQAQGLGSLSFEFLRIFRDGSNYVRPDIYVFSNGRQGCPVRVEFSALRDDVPTQLTAEEIFAGFKLIGYEQGELLGEGKWAAWKVWKLPTVYNWNEAVIRMYAPPAPADAISETQLRDADVRESGTQTVNFWVMTEAAQSPRVAVAFFDKEGVEIASTNHSRVEEGSGYGDGEGKFNSSVNIRGIEFVQPDIREYGRKWEQDAHRLLDTRVKGSVNSLRSYEQYITLTHQGYAFRWRSITDRGDTGFSLWNDEGKAPSGAEWCVTYVIQPGQRTYEYSNGWIGHLKTGVSHDYRWNIWTLMGEYAVSRSPDNTVATIGMILSDDHWQIYDWNDVRVPSKRSRDLVLLDEFGNEHLIRLFLIDGNGFNYVAIDRYSKSAAVAAADFSIDSLAIQLQQNRLYANGRQQVRVGISVEPKLGGVDTSLTEQEWASIYFLDHDSRKQLPFTNTEWTGGNVGWAAQRDFAGYDYFPGTQSAPAEVRASTRYFFISVDAAARGTPLRLAFSIEGRNGKRYETSGFVTEPDGSERYETSYDVNLGIDITQENPARYTGGDISVAWRGLPLSDAGTAEAVFNRTGVVTIQPRTGPGPSIMRMACTPAGVMHWQTMMPGDTNPCAMGYAQPGSKEIRCDPGVAALMRMPTALDRAEMYSGVIVLCGRVGVPIAGNEKLPRDRMAMTLLDAYGSEHELTVQFVSRERDEIEFV